VTGQPGLNCISEYELPIYGLCALSAVMYFLVFTPDIISLPFDRRVVYARILLK
jgi:hypothetical protein